MKKPSIKLSIIVPVYNVDKYLKRCLKSILSQTLTDIEILVIDDGSTDNSWSIIQDFALKDKRIVAIRQRNHGVSAARNTGMNRAKGEYVGFVDSDDFIDPGYFENLYLAVTTNEADVASGYVEMKDEQRQRFYNYVNKRAVRQDKRRLVGVVWLNIYRSSMLRQNNIHFLSKLRTAEDNLFNLQASYHANKIVSVDDTASVYHHQTRQGSLTAQQQDGKNLLLLSYAVLETTNLLNSLPDYDQEVYTMRILDTLNYFYQRFIQAEHVGRYTRYRISVVFIRIGRRVKYRKELLEAIQEQGINLEEIMYGYLPKRLYIKYVNQPKVEKKKIMSNLRVARIKELLKKVAKFILPHGVVVLRSRHLERIARYEPSDKKIAIVAAYRRTQYIKLLKKAVQAAGYEVTDDPRQAKYIWLHWYENGINNYSGFIDKLSVLKSWKDQGKKVIMHVHNKKPHESTVPNLSHALMVSLFDSADHISIMSSETKDVLEGMWYYGNDFSHTSLVPHPNYINAYGKQIKDAVRPGGDRLKILFFGLVRPYKGIERLIAATEGLKNVDISIFGKPNDDEYLSKIMDLCASRKNIKLRLEHIPDKDIPQIFADHHIVALPYSTESSLNSGAALLALSYGRTVVGTNNGTLKELGDDNLYFGYDYKDEEDHVRQLRKTIQTIQAKYGDDYNELLKVGASAYRLVERHNSIAAVASSIEAMMRRLG